MKEYKADLHIHTVLSPCASLEMSPTNIIKTAKSKGLHIIGITDHNSTRQCAMCKKIGNENDLFILQGCEVSTKEEIHCLAFFEFDDDLNAFQHIIDAHLPAINNESKKFGFQVLVNEADEIIYEEERLLMNALTLSIDEIERAVHKLNGIFIPAHINRTRFSIISQLGFIPSDLKVEALELAKHNKIENFIKENPMYANYPFIQNSDAHYIEDIGSTTNTFLLEQLTFSDIRKAIYTKVYKA